ncbi:hypothetical protein [Desulfitobacterium hafniense]|uniref:hypothetical protein n=1 Tax=Desulfitobacterium hafniense TaxID=49338 RepID=UPI0003A0F762|nr:hypothetical protein [Desulfitobacterium hafniense]
MVCPIHNNPNEVIGSVALTKPVDMQEDLKNMAGSLDETDQILGLVKSIASMLHAV